MEFAMLGALIVVLALLGRRPSGGTYALVAAGAVVAGIALYYK